MSMLNILLAGAQSGTLTLFEEVFNASGTFTMPSGVVNNEVIVGCTGGGGGGWYVSGGESADIECGGGGSGRTYGSVTLSAGTTVAVTVGAGSSAVFDTSSTGSQGGTSSFGGYVSCAGGKHGRLNANQYDGAGVNGGGNGGATHYDGSRLTSGSNCPAMFSLQAGAVDNTNKFYQAKAVAPLATSYRNGGSGCYGAGVNYNAYPVANSGAGGFGSYNVPIAESGGGSGKVVVYYYKYV